VVRAGRRRVLVLSYDLCRLVLQDQRFSATGGAWRDATQPGWRTHPAVEEACRFLLLREGLSDEQVSDEVIIMLLAATETTANAMSWALHVLGQRPDLEARLHAEVDAVLAGGELTFDHVGRLAYTRRLVTETLRLYSPIWMLTRRTTEPVTLGPFRLPAGATVLFSPYAIHGDPRLYADAEHFDPDRWLPDRAGAIPRLAFIPFGAGNRQCIGEGFAWTEAIIVLATIARDWRLRPVPGTEVRMVPSATLTPSQLPMLPQRRTAEPAESTEDAGHPGAS
jgi:cytochrome P450